MPNRSHGHYFKLGMHTHTVRFSKAPNHFFTQYKAWDILDRDKIWKIHDEQISTPETVRDQPVARTQDALPVLSKRSLISSVIAMSRVLLASPCHVHRMCGGSIVEGTTALAIELADCDSARS